MGLDSVARLWQGRIAAAEQNTNIVEGQGIPASVAGAWPGSGLDL